MDEKKPPLQKRILSIQEVKAEFGLSRWFWRKQVREKKLPAIPLGRHWYLDRKDIEAFLKRLKEQPLYPPAVSKRFKSKPFQTKLQ